MSPGMLFILIRISVQWGMCIGGRDSVSSEFILSTEKAGAFCGTYLCFDSVSRCRLQTSPELAFTYIAQRALMSAMNLLVELSSISCGK